MRALRAFDDNRIFGIGWFGFRTIVAPTVFYTGHAHNVYIQLLCETGIVGFSVIMISFAYFLYKGYRALYYVAHNKNIIRRNMQILVLLLLCIKFIFCFTVLQVILCMMFMSSLFILLHAVYQHYIAIVLKKGLNHDESGNSYLS